MLINLLSVNGNINVDDTKYTGMSSEEKIRSIVDELMLYAGRIGGECYSSDSLASIQNESESKTRGRINFCLVKGHHSLFEHPMLTFEFVNVPKFIFMMLNNQYVYSTSERSARYTDFYNLIETDKERELYTKWSKKISDAIKQVYGGKFTEKERDKLAQENARYMISVFVPSSMVHTISLRQLNYVMYFMENFLKSEWESESDTNKAFMKMLRPRLEKFLEMLEPYKVEGLIPKCPAELAIFKKPIFNELIADSIYRLNYQISFAGYAQNHRHRSIRYSMRLMNSNDFYVPEILSEVGLVDEWKEDMNAVANLFPQGTLIWVTEDGEIEDFVKKCYERSCGRAQKEIQDITNNNLEYLRNYSNGQVKAYLEKTTGDGYARCGFPNYKCTEPCKFGLNQKGRKI